MKALFSTPGGTRPVEIREVDEPRPAPHEALVAVAAASLNRGELSLLPARPGWRPGQDIAGTVVAPAADGSGPQAGARVTAVVDQAGWAERVAAPTARLAVLPERVSFREAATLGVAGLTALRALRVGPPLLGARVLVTGASGGVGYFAVQLAHLGGAQVTAVVRTPERGERLLGLGADRVVLETDPLETRFDLAMEGVGGPSLERSLHALDRHGVVLLYGRASDQPARVALGDFVGRPSRIQSFFVYETGVETFGADLGYLAGLLATGQLHVEVGLEVNWQELDRGLAALRDREVPGKVVLRIDGAQGE
jgi:NADPH:quinone reductase-like Zn-dependent oxidoreductase